MLNIIVSKPDLQKYANGELIVGVIVEVDTVDTFTNPTVYGGQNVIQYSFTVNKQYPPGTTLYARARYVFDVGGLQGWSSTFVAIVKDKLNIQINLKEPIVTEAPEVTLSLDRETYPEVGVAFNVTRPTFSNRVKQLRYVVTDDTQQQTAVIELGVSWSYDNIVIHNRLHPSRNYTIRVAYEFDTGALSMFGGINFVTGSDRSYIHFITGGDLFTNNKLVSFRVGGYADSIHIEIIKDGSVTYSATQGIGTVNVDGHVPESPYAISVTPTTNSEQGNPIYKHITKDADVMNTLPAMISYVLN